MPTQRSFFSHFFGTFKARSSPTFSAKTSTTTGAVSGLSYSTTTSAQYASPSVQAQQIQASRILQAATSGTRAGADPDVTTPVPVQPQTSPQSQSSSQIQISPSPMHVQPLKSTTPTFNTLSTSPGTYTYLSSTKSPISRPPSPNLIQVTLPPTRGIPIPITTTRLASQQQHQRARRGSGSSHSSGGFVDAAIEKWYIGGGPTSAMGVGQGQGQGERFYQLGVIAANAGQSARSLDRLSL